MRLLLSAFLTLSPPPAWQPVTTADLSFLTGCWTVEANGRRTDEHWMAPAGGTLLGLSRTVAGNRTTAYEFLQIRDLPDGLTYIAKPGNQPEARFVAIAAPAGELVFENPSHDYPQRIRYRLSGDTLHARVEGTMKGKPRADDYRYTRTSCTQ